MFFSIHFFFSFSLQFGGVLTVVISKEKKGIALVEFSNAQAAVSILTHQHCHQFRRLLSTYWLITLLPVIYLLVSVINFCCVKMPM